MSRLPELAHLDRLLRRKHQPPLSAARIADELQCHPRSVRRYVRELREWLGYPIEFDKEANGYRLVPGKDGEPEYELPGLFFTESELSALLTMRELLSAVRPSLFDKDLVPLGNRIEKLIAATGVEPAEVARRIRILSIGTRVSTDSVFRRCADATLSRKRLSMSYKPRGRDGDWEEREISPQRLVRYRDNWYLDAWCHVRNALRVFALDQMQNARTLETPAKDVPDAELDLVLKSSYGIFSGEPTATAVLRFTPHRAQWVSKEDWHPEQKSRVLDDGSYELTIPYGRPEELLMDVLKHGAEVEVIEPAELRSRIADLARDMGALYTR